MVAKEGFMTKACHLHKGHGKEQYSAIHPNTVLDGCIKLNFEKVRVNQAKPTESEQLYNQLGELQGKEDCKV